MPSIERRLQRLIENERIAPLTCWQAFLAQILPFWQNKEVILVLDCTPYCDDFTIVYVGLMVHRRVLPPLLENHAAANRVGTRAVGIGA